jgi:hypothetical protein
MIDEYLKYQLGKAPAWLRGPFGEGWIRIWGNLKDSLLAGLKEAVRQRYPTEASPAALEAIGQDRQLERMPDQEEGDYAAHLEQAFELWIWGGTAKGVRDALIRTRLFDPQIGGSGAYTSPDVVANWRWAPDDPRWARFWVVITQPHVFGPPPVCGVGKCGVSPEGSSEICGYTLASVEQGQLLRRQVATWMAGHARCEGIIIVVSGTICGGGKACGATPTGDGILCGATGCLLPVPLPKGNSSMSTIVEVSEFTAVVGVIDDGDLITSVEFRASVQPLANRTKFLYDALVAGASHLRTVADAAALRALTSHANGDVAALAGGSNGCVFVYDAASARTDDGVMCVKPTDVGAGAGRWLHPAVALLGLAGPTFTGDLTAGSLTTSGGGNVYSTGNVFAEGAISADGGLSCGGSLTVGSAATLSGLATCSAGLVVSGGSGIDCNGAIDVSTTSDLHGAVRCYSTLQVDGTSTLTGGVTCSSTLGVTGKITAGGGIDINGASSLTQPMASSGVGRVRVRRIDGADAPASYGINDADEIRAPTLAGNRTWTLVTTGAANGDRIRIVNYDPTFSITVQGLAFPGAGLALTIGGINAADFTFDGTGWYASTGF